MTIDERNNLALENDKLIHDVAKKYSSLATYEDLYQEGFIALLSAAENWDPAKGQFSTYAWAAINNALKRYVIGDNPIPVPEYKNQDMMAIAAIMTEFENAGGTASHEDVADRMGCSEEQAKELLLNYRRKSLMSMDAKLETGDSFGEMMADEGVSVEDEILEADQANTIVLAIKEIYGKDEAGIVSYYLGLGGCRNHTLDETGAKFSLTKERVRQIVAKVQGKSLQTEKAKEQFRAFKILLKDC